MVVAQRQQLRQELGRRGVRARGRRLEVAGSPAPDVAACLRRFVFVRFVPPPFCVFVLLFCVVVFVSLFVCVVVFCAVVFCVVVFCVVVFVSLILFLVVFVSLIFCVVL